MTKDEAREKFRLADRLFNESQFAPALKVLTELNAAFPNERHVLYPMARCLTGLGRNAEALDLADRVVRQFDYGPAVDLYKRLKAMKTGDGIGMLDSTSDPVLLPGGLTLDSDPVVLPPGVPKFDSDPPRLPRNLDSLLDGSIGSQNAPPPPLPASSGASWQPIALWVGLAVGAVVLMMVVYSTAGRPFIEWQMAMQEIVESGGDPEEAAEDVPISSMAIVLVCWLVTSYFISIFPGYWALKIMEALPYNDFGDDMKDIALYTLYGYLLSPLIAIGWLIFLVILRRHYELSAGKQFIVVMLWFVFDFGVLFVCQLLIEFVGGMAVAAS